MCDRIAIIQNGRLIDLREMNQDTATVYYVEATPTVEASAVLDELSISYKVNGSGLESGCGKTANSGNRDNARES